MSQITGVCVDVDECLDRSTYTCSQNSRCVNTQGSYLCVCEDGFERINGRLCEDIDECQSGRNTCNQECENTEGSYQCRCKHGFTMKSGKCEDENECSTSANICVGMIIFIPFSN